jgi:hypothetical protein
MTHRQLILTLVRSAVTAVLMIAIFYLMPWVPKRHDSAIYQLILGLSIFTAALIYQVVAIMRNDYPLRRAIVSMAVLLPLFIVVFAWTYYVLGLSNPANFSQTLTKTDSLYFTIVVLTTVGFGDIVAKTEIGRIFVMIQMVMDIVVIVFTFRVIFDFASRKSVKKQQERASQAGSEVGEP